MQESLKSSRKELAVQFELDDREQEQVLEEIEPLVGPDNSASRLPIASVPETQGNSSLAQSSINSFLQRFLQVQPHTENTFQPAQMEQPRFLLKSRG